MDSINGSLAFRASLDIDDFSISAKTMEDRIRRVSATAIVETERMDSEFAQFAQRAGQYISYYLVGQGMKNLLSSIVQVRGQFQQLEIAFGTMLGSEEKAAALMDQMVETAAKTPFDLMGVAEGAKQLMAYGVEADKVNDTLVRLGNIASGLSIPLNDIVYLYGTTMVQGRLYAQDVRQFTGRGIPLVKELAEKYHVTAEEINAMVSAGKIGFSDVEEVLNKMTDAGGQFYNLMEKQSASLTGQIANLEDAWDTVLNEWGKSNEGLFSGAIQSVTWLVEHMDDIINILKVAVTVWGTYKAALIANTLVTKGYTGVALIDNTVRSAKIALLKAEANVSGRTKDQITAMMIAEQANTDALKAQLSAEQLSNIQTKIRVSTIDSLLTAQQKEYLSNLNLTKSSVGYEAAALQILSVEQKEALSKIDLSEKSAIYRAALRAEVEEKEKNQLASISQMRIAVKSSIEQVEAAKLVLLSSKQTVAAAGMELAMAKQSGDAIRIRNAQLRMEAAIDAQSAASKRLLALQSSTVAKQKALEALESKKAAAASVADTIAKKAQTTATTLLGAVTSKVTTIFKGLWATMMANPLTTIITLFGTVLSLLPFFRSKEEEAKDALSEFNEETNKATNSLKLYFDILAHSDAGTKTHKDVLEKINSVCQEYNKTLLEENATLDEQRDKYEELSKAIKETTAEKIRAKYAEEAMNELIKAGSDNLDSFKTRLNHLEYNTGRTRTVTDRAHGETYEVPIKEAAEHIQNMAPEVTEAIQSLVESGANELAKLTGDDFNNKYEEVVSQICSATKAATGATEGEMRSFEEQVRQYLNNQITDVQTYEDALASINRSLELFFAPKDTGLAESTDYAKMSFEELEDEAKSVQSQIDAINSKEVKVDADTSELERLLGLLNQINAAIDGKTTDINTNEGAANRRKQLIEQRDRTPRFDANGNETAEYKALDKQINDLGAKFSTTKRTSGGGGGRGGRGGRGGANDAARNAENLRKKQLEADRKYEEARIAIMEDGYEKRKAQLDFEHKQNLQRIDEERKELEDARKKAGKGVLSADELAAFNDRIRIENESYLRSQNQLMIAEIAEKKKQYELYYRWVHNMGEEVANTQFADLLKNGASFKAYLEAEIQKLKDRKNAGETLSSQDNTYLFTLQSQLDEISGLKSAMDQFKESVSKAIGITASLAEKLEAIAKAKKDLADGKTGLVGDELTQAALHLEELERDAQDELHNRVITEYRSYEEQKTSIQRQYQLEREVAQRMGDEERIRQINKAEAEALSALNLAFLQQSDSWKRLFDDIDNLSVSQLQKLIDDIQKQIDDGTLELSPVDYKAVIDSLNKAKEELLKRNPFKALGKFYDDYIAARKKLADAKAKLAKGEGSQSDVDAAEAEVKRAARGITDAIQSVMEIAGGCAKSLQDMFDALGMDGVAEGIGTALELMGELGNMAGSVGKLMSGDILGGVMGLVSSAASLVGIFAKLHDKKYEKRIQNLQEQIDNLERSYSRLERAFNNTYWVFNAAEKEQFEKNVDLIEQQISALEEQRQVALKLWDFEKYTKLTAEITKLKGELKRTKESGDMLELYQYQVDALREQQELIRQQIAAENSKKKTDKSKIQQYQDQIESIEQQIEDLDRQMMETFAGTDVKSAIDEFADALVEAYCAGEDAAKALAETTKKVLKNAVVEALKREFLAKAINDAVVYLGGAMSDGVLSDEEKAQFETMVNAAGDVFNNALEGIGDWIKDMEDTSVSDPLTGAVKSMSEETAGVIAGRLNAFIINQTEQTNALRDQLMYQAEIAHNTAITADGINEIKATLRRIETKDNSLLSQGIS